MKSLKFENRLLNLVYPILLISPKAFSVMLAF